LPVHVVMIAERLHVVCNCELWIKSGIIRVNPRYSASAFLGHG
jgi:hypothetical protein